ASMSVIHEEAGLCQGHGLRGVGRLAAGGGSGCCGDAPVIHPAARGGPECRAGLGGSIKWAAVACWRGQTFMRARPSGAKRWSGTRGRVQVVDGRSWRRRGGERARRPPTLQGKGLGGAQGVITEREHAASERDLGDVATAAFGDSLEGGAQRAAALGGLLRSFYQRPADVRRALLGDVPEPSVAIGGADGWGETGPGTEVAGS